MGVCVAPIGARTGERENRKVRKPIFVGLSGVVGVRIGLGRVEQGAGAWNGLARGLRGRTGGAGMHATRSSPLRPMPLLLFRLTSSLLLLCLWASCSHSGSHAPTATRDLVLIAGQSNAVGFDAYASELPPDATDRDVMFWWRVGDPPPDDYDVTSGGKWSHLQSQPRGTPLETTTAEARAKSSRQYGNFKKPEGGFGPEIGLARELRAREGRPLAIVKAAFS
eukprot:gene38298-51723_t